MTTARCFSALAMASALALAGCGGDVEPAPATRDEPAPATRDEPAPATREEPTREPAVSTEATPAEPATPWRHLAGQLPDALGAFRAQGDPRENEATVYGLPLPSTERRYAQDDVTATVRIVDAEGAPALVTAFATAREIELDTVDDLAKPLTVQTHPATLHWSRDTGSSHVSVLVAGRFLLSVELWPASDKEAAVSVVERVDIPALARIRTPL